MQKQDKNEQYLLPNSSLLINNNYERLYQNQYQIYHHPSESIPNLSKQALSELKNQRLNGEQIKNNQHHRNDQNQQKQLRGKQQNNYDEEYKQFQQNAFEQQQLKDKYGSKSSLPNKSPYIDQYKKKFGSTNKPLDLQLFLNRISLYGIHLQYHLTHPVKFQMKLIGQTRNSKIMTYQIRFSYFIMKIQIFNINRNDNLSPIFQKWINEGAYGAIYEANFCNKKYAVKKIGIGMQPFQMIKRIVKQYCILKLCGALSIGPKVAPLFGFDIIVTGQSAYFSSELGTNFYDYLKYLSLQKSQNQLKEEVKKMFSKLEQSLKLLHQLNITHNDIKPNNIVYSPSFNKLVFIDFGLSDSNQFLKGYWKPQLPKGSLNFCCQDMRKLILERGNRKNIDLFYNDMVAMQKTQQAIYQTLQTIHIQGSQSLNITINQISIYDYQEQKNKYNHKLNYQFSIFDNFLKFSHNSSSSSSKLSRIKMNKQSEIFYCISFIYLIHKRKQQTLQQLCQKDQHVRQILNINLYRIYFIFFQQYSDKRLIKLYDKVKQILKNNINQESHFIIINKLNIYFFNNNEYSRSIKQKYEISQERTKRIINLRYRAQYEDKGDKQKQKVKNINFTINCYQTIQSIGKRIIEEMTIQQFELLEAIRQTKVILTNYNKLIKQQPQIPYNILKTFFHKLGFNIEFNSLQLWQKNICYLKILAVIHMHIIKNYDMKQLMCYLLLEEAEHYAYNSQNIKLMNKILDFVYEGIEGEVNLQEEIEVQQSIKYPTQEYRNYISEQLQQKQPQSKSQQHEKSPKLKLFKKQKFLLKKNSKYILSYKQKLKIPIKLILYQQSMLILYKLTNCMNIILDYQKMIDYSKIYIHLLKQKLAQHCELEQSLLSHEQSMLKQLKILYSTFYYLDLMVFQHIDYLRVTLSQTFTKFDNNGDIVPMVELYQILLSIIQLFRKYFQFNPNNTKYKTRNYLRKNDAKVVTLLLRYLYITKTLFSTLIYTSSICQQTYQKYDLTYKYFQIFKKISFQTFQEKNFGQLEVKLISKIIQILVVDDKYQRAIQFLDYLEKQKSVYQSYQFLYLKYLFYKRYSNSKYLIQINKKLQKLHNFHQTQNDEKNSQQQRQIHKIDAIFQSPKINLQKKITQKSQNNKFKFQNEQFCAKLNKLEGSNVIRLLNNKLLLQERQKQQKIKHFNQENQNQENALQNKYKDSYSLSKSQYITLKQYCKKTCQIIQKMNKNNLSYKLFYYRQMIRKIIVCKQCLNDLLSQLLQKYTNEVQNFIKEIYKNLQFLKQNQKILPKKISHFYGYLRNKQDQQRFWSNVKKEFYYNKKIMLLRQIIEIPKSPAYNFNYLNMIYKQWKGIHDSLIEVFLRQKVSKKFKDSNINTSSLLNILKNQEYQLYSQKQIQKPQFESRYQKQLKRIMIQNFPFEYFQIKCKYRKLFLTCTRQYIQINYKLINQKNNQQFDKIYQRIYQRNKQKYQESLIEFLMKLNHVYFDYKENNNSNCSVKSDKGLNDNSKINSSRNLGDIKKSRQNLLVRDFTLQKQQTQQQYYHNLQQIIQSQKLEQKKSTRNQFLFFNYLFSQQDKQYFSSIQERKKGSKTQNVTIKQIMSFKKINKPLKYRSHQIFLEIILNCYTNLINCQKFIVFITKQSYSNKMSSNKIIQLQLKLIFCEVIEFKQLNRMFQINSIYLSMIKTIIEIEIKQIFINQKLEKQQQQQKKQILQYLQSKTKYKKQQYQHFFIYVLMEVEKYINKYSCSSYSSILIHLFNYVQNCIKANLSKINSDMENLQDKLITLSNLQRQIFTKSFDSLKQKKQQINKSKQNKKQKSAYDPNIIMLINIQKIKLQQLYKSLINQNKNNFKNNQREININKFRAEYQNRILNQFQTKQQRIKQQKQMIIQLKYIKKLLVTIFSKIYNLQYICKIYVLHILYHYLVKLIAFYSKYDIHLYDVDMKHFPFLFMNMNQERQQKRQLLISSKNYLSKDMKIDSIKIKENIKNKKFSINMKKLKKFKINMFRRCRKTNQIMTNPKSQLQGKQYESINQNYFFNQFQMIDQNFLVDSILSIMFQFQDNNIFYEDKYNSLYNKINLKAQQKLTKYLQTIR